MPLDRDELRRIAALARLELGPEEEASFVTQLGRVVEAFDALADFEVAEPGVAEVEAVAPDSAADRPLPGLSRDVVLALAPRVDGGFFVVPPILPPGPAEDRR